MGQSLHKVLQPDGSYKWQLVDMSEAHGIVPVGKDGKPEIPAPAPKRTRKAKPQVEEPPVEEPNVDESIESTPES